MTVSDIKYAHGAPCCGHLTYWFPCRAISECRMIQISPDILWRYKLIEWAWGSLLSEMAVSEMKCAHGALCCDRWTCCLPCRAISDCSSRNSSSWFNYYICLQHALRLQAFRQLHKVLGIDPPPPPTRFRGRFPRGGRFKRRREDSGQAEEGAKKEKKDGGEETSEPMQTSEQPAATEAKAWL